MQVSSARLLQWRVQFSLTLNSVVCNVLCVRFPQTPSSVFWKELSLAMPRRVVFHSQSAGDPQIVLQDDKDPMLTLDSDYQATYSDTDPAGDLGKNNGHRTRRVYIWFPLLSICTCTNEMHYAAQMSASMLMFNSRLVLIQRCKMLVNCLAFFLLLMIIRLQNITACIQAST